MACEDVLEKVFLQQVLDAESEVHLRECLRCASDATVAETLSRAMVADSPSEPPAMLSGRVLRAAEPLLAHHRTRATWRGLSRAVGAALLPLPLVLVVDAYILGEIHRVLSFVLPRTVTLYVLAGQTTLIALLLAIAYGAIPLLVERQRLSLYTRGMP